MINPAGPALSVRRIVLFALLACLSAGLAWLAPNPAPAQEGSGPGAEPADKSDCTGTCSTCPGKAKAMLSLAEYKKALLKVSGLDSEALATRLHDSLVELDGLATCMADSEAGTLWLAYDAEVIGLAAVSKAAEKLGVKTGETLYAVEALPAPGKGHEHAVVYIVVPAGDEKAEPRIQYRLDKLGGVTAQGLDRSFNMLLVDYETAKTSPAAIRDALVALGYPAGLPGEEIVQPK